MTRIDSILIGLGCFLLGYWRGGWYGLKKVPLYLYTGTDRLFWAMILGAVLLICGVATAFGGELVSPQREAQLRSYFPATKDGTLHELTSDPGLILYDESSMPPAYQKWDGALHGVHSPRYNIRGAEGDPHGNANVEFPWGRPAGTHRVAGVTSFRFIQLPKARNGSRWPIVYWREQLPRDEQAGFCWEFPVGAVVGEVLCQRGPDGRDRTFEVRTRTRTAKDWQPAVYRPFLSPEELAAAIRELRPQRGPKLEHAVARIEAGKLEPFRLADTQPLRAVFRQSSGRDVLPALGDDKLVAELLRRDFKDVHGSPWRTAGKLTAHAPATEAPWHIVPAGYDGCAVEVSVRSCQRCHDTTQRHAEEFAENRGVARYPYRDWYARVRGSGGIFSFHPFNPASISYNGSSRPVAINARLVNAGVIAEYNPRVHVASKYQVLEAYDPARVK